MASELITTILAAEEEAGKREVAAQRAAQSAVESARVHAAEIIQLARERCAALEAEYDARAAVNARRLEDIALAGAKAEAEALTRVAADKRESVYAAVAGELIPS